ncbi:ABC transporter ATP-binding protein [Ruegeria arenilitoris]|uniref:ABC transporter ATP-binding protein n=1 Tax=Ruegeria arenilitoris TaxID=1173585 RepID=UPI001481C1E3|nr:ABC transporter ATP-binding protein [Ruegeria arenilitoris]
MTLLSLRNIQKHFGAVRAVDGIDLDIRENEFFALLGASGSGKTTLLRLLAGFEPPTGGEILLDGHDISAIPPNKRPVNLMFQSYALFPHMSVAQNIAYGLEMERLPRAEIKTRVDEILEVIQLGDLAKRKPDQLSGGQRQRVALARALVKRPRLLLLDEPLGALDKKLRGEMQLELKRIQDEFGITFIIVTHDQEEALVMADRIAILRDGKLLQCGTPHEIYEHPESRFAADFIGVMNFLPVEQRDGKLLTASGDVITAADALDAGQRGVAAVRPERLHLGDAQGENRLTGKVSALAYHGLDLQLHLMSPAAPDPVMVRLTADEAETRRLAIGEEVTVSWAAKDTRIFAV